MSDHSQRVLQASAMSDNDSPASGGRFIEVAAGCTPRLPLVAIAFLDTCT